MTAFVSQNGIPRGFPLLRKREAWLPTWRGWVLILILCLGTLIWIGRNIHGFLALTRPVTADVLVIEGWVPDTVLKSAIAEFDRGAYRLLITCGGPRPRGHLTSDFPTYAAEAGAAVRKLGFPGDKLVEAPGERALRNRTFHSAQAVKAKLAELRIRCTGLNVVSEGAHARRTWIVFRRVFNGDTPVGIISEPPVEYDPRRWWASSEGTKTVLGETIGWLHEVLFR